MVCLREKGDAHDERYRNDQRCEGWQLFHRFTLSLSFPSERDREEGEEQAIVYATSVSLKMIYLLSRLNAADYCRTE